jgi:ketosteroid isomerase-like protein
MHRTFVVLVFLVLSAYRASAQQHIPGGAARDLGGERNAYRAQVRAELTQLVTQWADAWNADDAAGLSRLVARNGTLAVEGFPLIRGPRAVSDSLPPLLAREEEMRWRIADFETSGDLAYAICDLAWGPGDAGGEGAVRGRMSFVATRVSNSEWRVRSVTIARAPTPPAADAL